MDPCTLAYVDKAFSYPSSSSSFCVKTGQWLSEYKGQPYSYSGHSKLLLFPQTKKEAEEVVHAQLYT